MNDIKVVAFDCDGVMFDSGQANMDYYNTVLKYFGKPQMTPDQFVYAHMHTADEVLSHLFRDPESLEAAQLFRKEMSYKPFFKSMKIEPDLISLLKKIKPKYKTAIATNRTDTMQGILSEFNLESYFDLVVCALDVVHSKPHPESLLKIIEYFDVEPAQVLYVGDSVVDETAAKAANIPFVAYRNDKLSADYYIMRLEELEDMLLG
ncbi:MAG: HAD family hydrolase [Proteobacteria bacterium]|nr:HAD family hydrolase [Pseudomonadota bacterium]